LNSELGIRQQRFLRAAGLSAAACYLEERGESGYVWKAYKEKLSSIISIITGVGL